MKAQRFFETNGNAGPETGRRTPEEIINSGNPRYLYEVNSMWKNFVTLHCVPLTICVSDLLHSLNLVFGATCFEYFSLGFNPLKPELNPICYLLALLGAHHFLHVSRIRVKLLTLR